MSAPVPMFGTQNLKDDDGAVIDSFLIETDMPPDLHTAVEPILIPAEPKIIRPTRVFGGTEIITSSTIPYQLLPADPNRVQLHIDGFSYAATPGVKDYVIVADENGKVANNLTTQGPFRLRHAKGFDLDNHTGALWIGPGPITTDNFEITWRTVTS